ncbi:MAG TPA: PEGA domain-containing protein [Candidatus Saccharimonadales bacterium]|nr:PEGA domain-containing protein [Candidatus Saccharimonadales bacterium]
MDFLDPKKERFNQIKLMVGYGLVAIAIGMATLILIYQAYGYGYDQGQVTQNGLVFVSSQPSGANIYLNGRPYKSKTNSRVVVPADTYTLKIWASGYRTWQRQVVVNGGDVQHFDYPFLFPNQLKTSTLTDLNGLPSLATQSPDKRWLLLSQDNADGSFIQYDLKDPAKPVQATVTLPNGSFTPSDGASSWKLEEWANDNKHVLLEHHYLSDKTAEVEYVLVDRDTPVDSVDLTTSMQLTQNDAVSLYDNQISQFYLFNATAQTLKRVTASNNALVSQLENVLAFKPYGSNYILYVTNKSPTGKLLDGQVAAVLQAGQKTINLRALPAGTDLYSLNLAQYGGDWYVAVGASDDSAAYIYKNPQDQVVADGNNYPDPWRRLPVADPTSLSFSSNTQYLLAESGQNFVVYDFENVEQYHYQVKKPLDQPQTHAVWMDGNRLLYVSGGKLQVFDYDYRNRQELVGIDPNYAPFFSGDFSRVFALKPASANGAAKPALTTTKLTLK